MSQTEPIYPYPLSLFQGWKGLFNPYYPVTVAESATASSTISCGGLSLVGLLLPATLSSTTISFKASIDNTNFYPVYNSDTGDEITYTVAEGQYMAIDPKYFQGIQYLQLVMGTEEAAARTIIASLKGI